MAVRVTKEERTIIDAAMSSMDVVLNNSDAKELANRLNELYSMTVMALNSIVGISHASNIDDKETIQNITRVLQRVLFEFLTGRSIDDSDAVNDSSDDSSDSVNDADANVSADDNTTVESEVPSVEEVTGSSTNNVVSFANFKNKPTQ